jgi:IMP dehydrogenase
MEFKLINIETIEEEYYEGEVYDISVESDHSYNIENVCVHNSICTTRINTGHGVPLFQSLLECSKVANTAKVIADGGIKNGGDCVKSLAVGADFIMCGSILSGTDECPGDIIKKADGWYKSYRGMASRESMESNGKSYSIEGISTVVPYKGSVVTILKELEENIKSGLSYSGARNIKELRNKAQFVRQTSLGRSESDTHILYRNK